MGNNHFQVFNCDEAAFKLNPKGSKIYARVGDKTVYKRSGDEKKSFTVLFMVNGSGEKGPTMIVYQYERIPFRIASKVPHGWGIGRSDTGWMTAATFLVENGAMILSDQLILVKCQVS